MFGVIALVLVLPLSFVLGACTKVSADVNDEIDDTNVVVLPPAPPEFDTPGGPVIVPGPAPVVPPAPIAPVPANTITLVSAVVAAAETSEIVVINKTNKTATTIEITKTTKIILTFDKPMTDLAASIINVGSKQSYDRINATLVRVSDTVWEFLLEDHGYYKFADGAVLWVSVNPTLVAGVNNVESRIAFDGLPKSVTLAYAEKIISQKTI